MPILPVPPPRDGGDASAVVRWVRAHLGHLTCDDVRASAIPGGQDAADRALATLDLAGYAARRNEVLPVGRRGATGLSPYVRHGLLTLPAVWEAASAAPVRDREKFRDELLWQEYARHLYARVGAGSRRPLRFEAPATPTGPWPGEPWPPEMACVATTLAELHGDGWLVNQTRMWLSSQWTVRAGADWRDGEDHFFRHLLDGSRAANRLGWQWTVGAGTGRPYGFARHQVERRAPGLCRSCPFEHRCPIETWPDAGVGAAVTGAAAPDLRARPEDAGPAQPVHRGDPQAVWITAESLGDDDPARLAHPGLPVVFVFDEPLLARLRLSGKRLVFLAETLGELATRSALEVRLGAPATELAGRPLAATWTYVPGWRRLAPRLDLAAVHPWPWLRRPQKRSLRSFSAWAR